HSVVYTGNGRPNNSSGQALNWVRYVYNSYGCLVQKTESPASITTYNYKNADDPFQLTSTSRATLSYDQCGRLLQTDVGAYTYGAFGEIATYTAKNGDVSAYRYDANGKLRSQIINNNSKREFFYLYSRVVAEVVTTDGQQCNIARTYHKQYPLAQYSETDSVALF